MDSGVEVHGEGGLVRRKVVEGWRRVGGLVDGEEVRRLRVTYWYLLGSALLQDGKPLPLAISPKRRIHTHHLDTKEMLTR
jgi:hypothetical protein